MNWPRTRALLVAAIALSDEAPEESVSVLAATLDAAYEAGKRERPDETQIIELRAEVARLKALRDKDAEVMWQLADEREKREGE